METKEKEIVHFSHKCPLILKEKPPKMTGGDDSDDSNDSVVVVVKETVVEEENHWWCKACLEPIFSLGAYYYTCVDCNYDLHILRAQQPQKIDHPLHPEHPLTLRSNPPDKDNHYSVDCCKRFWKDFTYNCKICEFDMDIICATAGERKFDNPYHKHPLYLLRKPLTAQCNACGIETKGVFYLCTVCINYWIHQDCALLPSPIMIQQTSGNHHHHDHPLTLTLSLPNRHAQFRPNCVICQKGFDKNLWLYNCERCRYFVHINCTTAQPLSDTDFNLSDTFLSQLFEIEDVDLDLLELPIDDQSHGIVKQLSIKRGIDLETTEVNDSVHEHPLTLIDPQNDANQSILHNPMKRIELICSGCIRPITEFSFYKCLEEECKNFVLHEWCARLPSNFPQHLFHDKHPITLFRVAPKFFGIFACKICDLYSNGFAYGCVDCEYYIDVRCALLPDSLKHEAHKEHRIILHKKAAKPHTYCRSCYISKEDWSYFCDICSFMLCIDCTLFPKTFRHKYDRHILNLAYFPAQNHMSEYFCDICEEELDPYVWFYHCDRCDQSFHNYCINASCGVKYGGLLKVDYHPHPIRNAEWWIETKMQCVDCKNGINYGFRCVECKFAIDYKCASLRGS